MSDYRKFATLSSIVSQITGRVATLERESGGPPTHTTSTLPDADTVREGTIVFISDESAGQKVQYSDGTDWQPLG